MGKPSVRMMSATGKDGTIEFLLILLKEERDKRKEVEMNLEHTKTILDEMIGIQSHRERNNHHILHGNDSYFHRGRVECDNGVDEVDYSSSKNNGEIL